MAVMASGAAPPNRPECTGAERVETVRVHDTSPRIAVVMAGRFGLRADVGDDGDVEAEPVGVLLDELFEVRDRLLLPSTSTWMWQGGFAASCAIVA